MSRIAHLSDIHITANPLGWQWRDWFSKRTTSWFNHRYLGRGRRFSHAEEVMAILMRDVKQRGIEHMLFSGDATALGFEAELRLAAELLEVQHRPGLAVPGNHDYLTKESARSGIFEQIFAPWQTGQRLGSANSNGQPHSLDETYPFAQRLGPAWVIAVNSAVGNFWAFDAGGTVGKVQRERLRRLLAELSPGPRILLTHYPICLSNGRQGERTFRALRDLGEVVRIAAAGHVSVWLHGHRHRAYVLPNCVLAPFPVVCAGSATQTKRWSYNEYTITNHELQASRRTFDPKEKCFHESAVFKIPFLQNKD